MNSLAQDGDHAVPRRIINAKVLNVRLFSKVKMESTDRHEIQRLLRRWVELQKES